MQQDHRFSLRFLRAILLGALTIALSACAGRPKPLNPTTPFTVTEVRVMASSVQDMGFAGRLQERLEASVGRTTSDVGQTSTLRIVVQGLQEERSPVNLLGGTAESVSLDLSLIDSRTGEMLRTHVLRASYSEFNGNGGDTVLIARLTDDIRGVLGLSGYMPYPVSGPKKEVVWPSGKPLASEATEEARRSADPLLNGTVTPTTVNLEVETDSGPSVDFSKPLLDAKPTAKPSAPAVTMASPALVKVPHSLELPAQKPRMVNASADAGSLDEPCVITLDNECGDPDSR